MKARHISHLLLAFIVSQLLFWGVVLGAIFFSPLNSDHLKQFEVATISTSRAVSLTNPSPATTWTKASYNQWSEIEATTPGLYRFTINLRSTEPGLGIFVALVRDNATITVNGKTLGQPPTGNWRARPGLLGLYFPVPPELIRTGDNTVILMVNRDSHFTRLGLVYAGPATVIAAISDTYRFNKVTLPIVSLTISGVLGLACLALIPLGMNRTILLSGLATAATIAVGNLFYIDNGTITSHVEWLWYGNVFGAIGGYLAFVCLLNAWAEGPKWIYVASATIFVFTAVISAVVAPFLVYEAVSYLLMACVSLVMVFALPISLHSLARISFTPKFGDHWLGSILLISPLTAVVDLVLSILGVHQAVFFAPLSNLTLMLAISIAFARRGATVYKQAEIANATLIQRIAFKETELEASAAALRAQVAETAIQTERARIMRDMHDGMGGQLLSLLIQARDPDTPRAELEETVENAIADLRLLIDSLDSVGDDLEIALAMFKERLAPRLASAKVSLEWPNTPLGLVDPFSPAQILSIYRILQEAIANALRHGRPSNIAVQQSFDGAALKIILDDDGKGMSPDAQTGRGLTNMRRRAQELGGSLSVDVSALGGVKVTLSVPK